MLVRIIVPAPALVKAPLPLKPPPWVRVWPLATSIVPPLAPIVMPALALAVKPVVTSNVPPFRVTWSAVPAPGFPPSPLAAATEMVPPLIVDFPV